MWCPRICEETAWAWTLLGIPLETVNGSMSGGHLAAWQSCCAVPWHVLVQAALNLGQQEYIEHWNELLKLSYSSEYRKHSRKSVSRFFWNINTRKRHWKSIGDWGCSQATLLVSHSSVCILCYKCRWPHWCEFNTCVNKCLKILTMSGSYTWERRVRFLKCLLRVNLYSFLTVVQSVQCQVSSLLQPTAETIEKDATSSFGPEVSLFFFFAMGYIGHFLY